MNISIPVPPPNARCPVCHAGAVITSETQQLPCGHFAYRSQSGGVMGWVDTGVMTLKLARAAGLAVTDRMAERAEQNAAGVQRWRERTQALTAATAAGD